MVLKNTIKFFFFHAYGVKQLVTSELPTVLEVVSHLHVSPATSLYSLLFSAMRATCSAHLIHLDMVNRIILGHVYHEAPHTNFSSLLPLPPASASYFKVVSCYVRHLLGKTKFNKTINRKTTVVYVLFLCTQIYSGKTKSRT